MTTNFLFPFKPHKLIMYSEYDIVKIHGPKQQVSPYLAPKFIEYLQSKFVIHDVAVSYKRLLFLLSGFYL